ncbi:MAG: transporter substrate-binding domain-containing protein [Pseudomonadales bacterium]|nr:transporter substrate-binding domain-containing protein [Pseudomonadales bacterium]NRA15785.1 transporter substrate-binding domain-containing protein [Oceanospirillaceae bacterium]
MPLLIYALLAVSLCFSSVTLAKELRIAIGAALPPYVLDHNNAGIEVDIITEALKVKGYTVSFHFVPNLRLLRRLKNREVDGTVQNSIFDIGKAVNIKVYDSATTITYHNYAIAFRDKNLQIYAIKDLLNKRVLAFQNATKYLGSVYATMAKNNADYREHAKQSLQVKQLYADRVDVIISEKRIFNYWKQQAQSRGELYRRNLNRELQFHNIFAPSARNVKFVDSQTRDDFNDGLRLIKGTGLYQTIIDKYEDM